MGILTKQVLVQTVKCTESQVEVIRAVQVLDDGAIIATSVQDAQVIVHDQNFSELNLEPQVLAVLAAWWTPEQVTAGTANLLAQLADRDTALLAAHEKTLGEEATRATDLATIRQTNDTLAEGLAKTRDVINQSHLDLDIEQAALIERASTITANRTLLFQEYTAVQAMRVALTAGTVDTPVADSIIAQGQAPKV